MAAQPVLSDPGFSPPIVSEELAALGFTPTPIGLPRWLEWVDSFSVAVLNIALLLVVALVFANTLARSIFGAPFVLGIEEISQLLLVLVAFVGGAIAYRRGDFMAIKIFVDR